MLDARARARLLANRRLMRADRATPLVVVTRSTTGDTYTLVSSAVLRQRLQTDQTIALTEGTAQVDAVVELPLSDPATGAVFDPTRITYLALTTTPTAQAVALAVKYDVLASRVAGMVPNRLICLCRRLR